MSGIFRFLLGSCAAIVLAVPAFTQDIRKALDDKLVIVVDSILEDWNGGVLQFPPKAEMESQFFEMLDRRVQQKLGGYEDDVWRDRLKANWKMLPGKLTKPIG